MSHLKIQLFPGVGVVLVNLSPSRSRHRPVYYCVGPHVPIAKGLLWFAARRSRARLWSFDTVYGGFRACLRMTRAHISDAVVLPSMFHGRSQSYFDHQSWHETRNENSLTAELIDGSQLDLEQPGHVEIIPYGIQV